MDISAQQVKMLRDKTGVSVMACKRALEESKGDMSQAEALLYSQAGAAAQKKSDRALGAGTVASYIHITGHVGALLLLACETDFVSKNEEFKLLAKDIAMHAAAMKPTSVKELMDQNFIRDNDKSVADLIAQNTLKFGERIMIEKLEVFSV